jgi:hypothetical protein
VDLLPDGKEAAPESIRRHRARRLSVNARELGRMLHELLREQDLPPERRRLVPPRGWIERRAPRVDHQPRGTFRRRGIDAHGIEPTADGKASFAGVSTGLDRRAKAGRTLWSQAPLVRGQSEGCMPQAAKFPSACILQPEAPPQIGQRRQTDTFTHSRSAGRL